MKHRDNGTHLPRHDSAWIVGRFWGERAHARKQLRDMGLSPDATWALDRPIPLRVTADAWPEETR